MRYQTQHTYNPDSSLPWAVVIIYPNGRQRCIGLYATQQEASRWIYQQQQASAYGFMPREKGA